MKRTLGIVAVCCAGITTSHSQGKVKFDVQKLYEMCNGEDPTYCIAYIAGVTDTMGLAVALAAQTKELRSKRVMGVCFTSFLSYGAAKKAFMNWADKHPEKWGDEMNFGVIEALRETWPCKDTN